MTIRAINSNAEETAVAFVKITSESGKTWSMIVYNGVTYTISKLSEGEELTIVVATTINHTATANYNTLTLTEENNTITVTITKTSQGTFYSGTKLQATQTQDLRINKAFLWAVLS